MKNTPLMFLCMLAVCVCLFFDTPSTTVEDTAASVVIVHGESGYGSGSIVGVNCVLTARHVAVLPGLGVKTKDGDEHVVTRAEFDPNSDLALVYIEGTFDESPLRRDDRPLRVGDEVTMIGTPYTRGLMNCVCQGRVVKVDYVADGQYVNLDVLDVRGGLGCSGSPILDSSGAIRGVVVLQIGAFLSAVPVGELDVSP